MARFCSRQVSLYYDMFLRNLFSKLKEIPNPIAHFAMTFKTEIFTGSKYIKTANFFIVNAYVIKKMLTL